MTTEHPKQIALDQLDRISRGDIAGAAALLADDFVNHAAIPGAQGRDGFVRILEKLRTAMPDFHHRLDDVMVDGDKVMMRTMVTGTHTGPFTFANLELPATGKQLAFQQIHVVRVAGGKIAEHWMEQDTIALFRQLGLRPARV